MRLSRLLPFIFVAALVPGTGAIAQSAPAPEGGWLLLTSDDRCAVAIDGGVPLDLEAGALQKVPLSAGTHEVLAARGRDGALSRNTVIIPPGGGQKVLALRFAAPAPAERESRPANSAGATLMLLTDADCEVMVDETSVGLVARDVLKRVPVTVEDHLITAKLPDGTPHRFFVKVERPGQVAVAVACAGTKPAPPAPAAPAELDDAALDAWEMSPDDKYAVSFSLAPEMRVSGIKERGVYSASTFRAMYVVMMRDTLPAALIKQGFTVADNTPADCRVELAFTVNDSRTEIVLDSALECAGRPLERFAYRHPLAGEVPIWLAPSKNAAFAGAFLTPAADDFALRATRSRAVKRIAKAKAKD